MSDKVTETQNRSARIWSQMEYWISFYKIKVPLPTLQFNEDGTVTVLDPKTCLPTTFSKMLENGHKGAYL